uniref:Essential for reactive oxygen species protein n=1 Tax=Sinocyclocheilus grahami TaxID=75366 RepID=A0A672M1H8_SINGR
MGYMVVEKHTSDLLHLKRSPGIRSWSLLVGIASVGLAAAYYSADSILWKMFYVTGCFFVALQNMEEWEVRDVLHTLHPSLSDVFSCPD